MRMHEDAIIKTRINLSLLLDGAVYWWRFALIKTRIKEKMKKTQYLLHANITSFTVLKKMSLLFLAWHVIWRNHGFPFLNLVIDNSDSDHIVKAFIGWENSFSVTTYSVNASELLGIHSKSGIRHFCLTFPYLRLVLESVVPTHIFTIMLSTERYRQNCQAAFGCWN